MLIGLAYTKPGDNQDIVFKAFKEGLKAHGDSFRDIRYFQDLRHVHDCDAVVMVSYPDIASYNYKFSDEAQMSRRRHYSIVNDFRVQIYQKCAVNKKRLLCIDSGVLNFERGRAVENNTYQMGWDCIKGLGRYYNENSPPDRWNLLNKELKPWRFEGNYILVFGQVQFGVGSQHIDIDKWYKDVIFAILNKSKATQVVIRLHPNDQDWPFPTKENINFKFVSPKVDLLEHLKGAKVSVSFTSHAIVQSVLEGVPSFCCSKASMGYPLFYTNSVADVVDNRTNMPSREDTLQWLYNLAYTQWNVTEIKEGLPWNHLRKHVRDTDVRFDNMLSVVQLSPVSSS